jgi:hypothetical protein
MIEDVRSWTDENGMEHTASVCYVDAAGNKWYAFDRPMSMPAPRAIAAELAAEWALMNFTPEDLLAYVDKMVADANAGQIVDMFASLHYIRERVKWSCEHKSLLELAKCYFVINDEPLKMQTEAHDKLKAERFATDPDCRAFFLRQSFALMRGSSELSGNDIQAYSEAQHYMAMKSIERKHARPEHKGASDGARTSFMKNVRTSTRKHSS